MTNVFNRDRPFGDRSISFGGQFLGRQKKTKNKYIINTILYKTVFDIVPTKAYNTLLNKTVGKIIP
jgi:hypothetical protein